MSLFTSSIQTLKVPPEELQSLADKVHGYADQFAESVDLLNNLHETVLYDAWKGRSFDQLVVYNGMSAEIYSRYVEKLEDMANFLADVGKKMQEIDKTNSTKIKTTG